ncbi:hypothetical protein FXO38_16927 [Capsicum annuum]|nr:hypothetical protein FXO38_16927 [Capsicum annuum]
MLPALKYLYLYGVCIEDDDFKDLIAGCPRIEQLRIEDPEKLHIIVVSNPSLEIFLVHLPCVNSEIVIESLNLKSLEFISFSMTFCEVDITSTTTVRQLTLRDAYDPQNTVAFYEQIPST